LNLLLLLSALLSGLTGASAIERHVERSTAQHRAASATLEAICEAACAAVSVRQSAGAAVPSFAKSARMTLPIPQPARSAISPRGERRRE
jgi:hypothetical protein